MRSNLLAALILAVFAALALNSAAAVPLFEASDEAAHFLYAHTLAETGVLPLIPTRDDLDAAALRGDLIGQWSIESHQPPLYYAIGALLISPTARDDIGDYLRSNDLIFTWGRREANPNQWLHLPTPPTGDTHLAIWTLRLFSLALACGTLWCIYRAAYLASNASLFALTAMLTAACIPTFAAISASVNNDNLITFLSAAAVYWTLRVMRFGLRKYDWAVIALIISAIALTKFTGLSVVAVVGAGLWLALRDGKITRNDALLAVGAIVAATALNAGWWYARNWGLYGDPLAIDATRLLWGRDFAVASESGGLLAEIPRIWGSFWLMIGHLHQPVWAPLWFYVAALVLTAAAIIGVFIALVRRKITPLTDGTFIMLVLAAILPVGVLVYGTLSVDISYGRLLFPGLVGIVPLMILGWQRVAGRFAFVFALPLLAMTLTMPYITIRPAYRSLETVDALPESAVLLDIRTTGGNLSVLGYEPLPRTIQRGDAPLLTLYLTGSDARNPALTIAWLSPIAADNLGQMTVYPGMSPTDALADGVIYKAVVPTAPLYTGCKGVDSAHILCENVTGLLRLELKWQTDGLTSLDTADPNGQPVPILLDGPAYVSLQQLGGFRSGVSAAFGDIVSLQYADIEVTDGRALDMRLLWNVRNTPPPDLVLTVQIFDADGDYVTSADADIAGYPARAWVPNTRITDERVIDLPEDLPSGTYTIAVGWYTRGDLARLPVNAENARDNLAVIGTFDVIMDTP